MAEMASGTGVAIVTVGTAGLREAKEVPGVMTDLVSAFQTPDGKPRHALDVATKPAGGAALAQEGGMLRHPALPVVEVLKVMAH